jgi:hypothetical protein
MQTVKSLVDSTYHTISDLLGCLLLFISTLWMGKPSDEFTKDDADDILHRRPRDDKRKKGGFGGNSGTGSNFVPLSRKSSYDDGRRMRRGHGLRQRKKEK